jgi:hypothetical protein
MYTFSARLLNVTCCPQALKKGSELKEYFMSNIARLTFNLVVS